jgi:hypothetical protein
MKENWMTKEQAARECGVALFKIRRLVKMGLLEERRDKLDNRFHYVDVAALRTLLKDVNINV